MASSWFYLQAKKNDQNSFLLNSLSQYADEKLEQVYVIDSPLGESKYTYDYDDALVVLIPKRKILFINFGNKTEEFDEFADDFLEDVGSISDKFLYKKVLGRPKKWKEKITEKIDYSSNKYELEDLLEKIKIEDPEDQRKCELIISLLTGSINDVNRIGEEAPITLLDAVKQKIQLFDGDQTRFIYQAPSKKSIVIQGLSGTGKTELLLHKLKELYTSTDSSKIILTCHNKILANNLRDRIPVFFDFMKVEQQILWNKRLWCVHGWGSGSDKDSGAYRFICDFYGIPFHTYSRHYGFDEACKAALALVDNKIESLGPAFDYMLVDESQDFPESFFELCSKVTKKNIYIAGDIFQSIFDDRIISEVTPDFLLSKCYRTDPRTLMFAHGLGMGLFEDKKLRWLDENEWKSCGYIVENEADNEHVALKREPLRRFEDIDHDSSPSIEIIEYSDYSGVVDNIIDAIAHIKEEHPTVKPADIGVIFIHPSRRSYQLADRLQLHIGRNFDWSVNKAYESKVYDRDALFISNQNNVKGLEFPFIICIAEKINNNHNFRNALYMMLTRSFLKTFLVVSETENSNILPYIHRGIQEINNEGKMTIKVPGENEVDKTSIDYSSQNISLYDLIELACEDAGIAPEFRSMAHGLIEIHHGNGNIDETSSREDIKRIIADNYKYL
ncbi:DEAD/DEAH box helicase [Halomonas sp. GD1P12]|uniref:DEAD/DEAH box helicase n=1 Tax=Halomonas sp. GD1P12 TaxID=2982691 RepID=UPI0021E3A552|nr:AAA family ATPase [Halomonas sp. GD1P12]UYG00636.1 AAA family ATPase [Halomonas sp. GD1P12]